MSMFFTSGGQTIGASAAASVLPMNIQGGFPLGLTSLISLQSKELYVESSPAPQFASINSSVLGFIPNLLLSFSVTLDKSLKLYEPQILGLKNVNTVNCAFSSQSCGEGLMK